MVQTDRMSQSENRDGEKLIDNAVSTQREQTHHENMSV